MNKNSNNSFDVLIIGAGVIGCFIARELSKYDLKIALVDSHNDVGDGCSGANSAIIHSGYDPLPGTLKAKFNVLGNPMWDQLSEDLDFHFYRLGSLTVATKEEQLKVLNDLVERSKENGVEVKLLTGEQVKEIEPNITSEIKGALFAPTAGIVDPFCAVAHAAENAVDNGAKLLLSNKVVSISKNGDDFLVITNKDKYTSKIIINAAGAASDKVASMIENIDWKMIPRKGEYYLLDHFAWGFVNHTIFPLPSEKGKGVLVSPTSSGNYIVGPSSEQIEDEEDVSTDLSTLASIKKQAVDMIPNIPFFHTVRTFSGVRPTTSRHDFIIEYAKTDNHFINVAGIESPGFVSSPAIAEYVVNELVGKVIHLKTNKNFNPKVRKHPVLFDMGLEKRAEFVKNNPEYGQIICNCEKISLGEIMDVLNRNAAPTTIKGIKKRCRAGFGRCQGGFCQEKILSILAQHYNISPLDVLYADEDSNILKSKIKEGK